jgi:hypothetical protein
MSVVRSMWASVRGDPVFMRRVNGWLTIFWVLMIPFSIITGWINSVTYVAALSLWALVSGHWSAWQAARVEVAQAEEMEKREEEDVAGDVVERIVEETEVNPGPTSGKEGFTSAGSGTTPAGRGEDSARASPAS